jgi:hypothetical protein
VDYRKTQNPISNANLITSSVIFGLFHENYAIYGKYQDLNPESIFFFKRIKKDDNLILLLLIIK